MIKKKPKSLRICTLLDKPERRIKQVKVDYVGFKIENDIKEYTEVLKNAFVYFL